MVRLRFLLVAVFFFNLPLSAQTSGYKLFGGYSLEHIASGCGFDYTCGTNDNLGIATNLNGFAVSGTAYYRWLGITAQLTGNSGSPRPSDVSVRRLGIQFGPEFSIPLPRASLFAHALLGVMHQSSAQNQSTSTYTSLDYSQFLWSVGGGLDLKVAPHLWVRAAQIDFERHSVPVGIGSPQPSNGFRYSAGIVLKF